LLTLAFQVLTEGYPPKTAAACCRHLALGAGAAGIACKNLDRYDGRPSDQVKVGTYHRAKGLEWDVVIHLDPHRLPSKYAKTPSQLEQENNLLYVIETRAKRVLIHAALDQSDFA